MIPVVTILALNFGALFSGALIIETMFGYLGMGKIIYDAILGNDFNLALVGLLLATPSPCWPIWSPISLRLARSEDRTHGG